MKILVAVKRVIDYNVQIRVKEDNSGVVTDNVKMSTNPPDDNAIEEAVKIKEAGKATEIVAITIGDDKAQETVRKALAVGADRGIHIKADGIIEPLAVSKILKAVVNTGDAMNSESIHDGIDKNLSFDWELGDKAKTDEAFASADKIVKMTLTNNRLVPNAMEPRSYIGNYEAGKEEYTLYTTTQLPHIIRMLVCTVLGLEEHKVRVISHEIGRAHV